ncbi:hypothetical protein PAECIP111893_04000 [Paenibacillus plantiphilus]|uniref:Resolvase/invertase-type recombinase catalytic domain-containing protein n=1 Tax=Paenibacillus plantiphilus TaxID=2905650 RepID=A0ABM9CKL4_9BACL|nr:recombinase family protein [Paenibacillus plantiphilus]CAH1215668.1 hypothetical protein PAECIP111893_04000 [Paenibacillus plantiphilus]
MSYKAFKSNSSKKFLGFCEQKGFIYSVQLAVYKFDRFSRKRDDHVIYKALLNQCGVKVISVTEQTEAETPQDMLLEGMLEVISEFFNANLATEVRKGMTQNAKQGFLQMAASSEDDSRLFFYCYERR